MLYCTVLHYTGLHCTALHCPALHYCAVPLLFDRLALTFPVTFYSSSLQPLLTSPSFPLTIPLTFPLTLALCVVGADYSPWCCGEGEGRGESSRSSGAAEGQRHGESSRSCPCSDSCNRHPTTEVRNLPAEQSNPMHRIHVKIQCNSI